MHIKAPAQELMIRPAALPHKPHPKKPLRHDPATTARPPHVRPKPLPPGVQRPVADARPQSKPLAVKPDLSSRPLPPVIEDTPKPIDPTTTTNAGGAGGNGNNEPLTMEGLVGAWGKSDTPYDFNNDGTVNVSDLLYFINNWHTYGPPSTGGGGAPGGSGGSNGTSGGAPASELSAASGASVITAPEPETTDVAPPSNEKPGKLATGNVKERSRMLYDHLSGAGFREQPPLNIRELVDALNPSPRQAELMMKELAAKYPDGLGVNVVA